jgi:hypothetical protein
MNKYPMDLGFFVDEKNFIFSRFEDVKPTESSYTNIVDGVSENKHIKDNCYKKPTVTMLDQLLKFDDQLFAEFISLNSVVKTYEGWNNSRQTILCRSYH